MAALCSLLSAHSGAGQNGSAARRRYFAQSVSDRKGMLAAIGQLNVETIQIPLADSEAIYNLAIPSGKRLVVTIN